MACANCNDKCKWNIVHTCRVCELVDNDFSTKKVCFCTECGAYICQKDWYDLIRRTKAFVKDKLQKTVELVEDFVKKKGKLKDVTEEFNEDDEVREDAEIPT